MNFSSCIAPHSTSEDSAQHAPIMSLEGGWKMCLKLRNFQFQKQWTIKKKQKKPRVEYEFNSSNKFLWALWSLDDVSGWRCAEEVEFQSGVGLKRGCIHLNGGKKYVWKN